jgi:hypothetical protein
MFTLKIETENAAFGATGNGAAEIVRILRHVADRMEKQGHMGGKCMDINGNRVGEWGVTA